MLREDSDKTEIAMTQPSPSEEPADPNREPVEQEPLRTPAASLDVKKPSFARRAADRVAGPGTPVGRAAKPFARGLALAVLFFLLGMLLVEIRWYGPAREQIRQLQEQVQARNSELDSANTQRQGAEKSAQDAQSLAGMAQARLAVDTARYQLLQVQMDIKDAQVAAAQNDIPGAKTAVDQARNRLQDVLSRVPAPNQKDAENIQAIFTLIGNDLERDPKDAQQDMKRMLAELERFNMSLLGENPQQWNCTCQAAP